MRRALFLPCFSLTLLGADPRVEAPIRRVRVYPSEAWVVRVVQYPCPTAGTYRVRIPDLPAGLTLDDVRVQINGPEGVRLGNVSVGNLPLRPMQSEAWRKLAEEQRELQGRMASHDAPSKGLQDALELLQKIQATPKDTREAYRPPSAENFLLLARSLQEQQEDLLRRMNLVSAQRRPIEAQLEQVHRAMDRLRNQETRIPTEVKVEFSTPFAGTVELEVQTRTTGARWKPSYEVRLSDDKRSLELACLASVSQLTGEDWKDVAVEIANAQPSRNLGLPTPRTKVQLAYREQEPPAPAFPPLPATSNPGALAMVLPGTNQVTSALIGRVVDKAGAPLPGAQVAIQTASGSRMSITDAQGVFRLPLLNPGTWNLTVNKSGFSSSRTQVQLLANQMLPVEIRLSGSGESMVEVVATTAAILGEEPPSEPALEAGPAVIQEAQGLSRTFRVEGSKDIPSDAQPYRFLLTRASLKPTLRYRCVPEVRQEVFLLAQVQPEAQFPWFPGTATAVYLGGNRLGQVGLPHWSPGQAIAFSFGPQAGLEVVRQTLAPRTETAGLLGRERVWHLRTLVRLENRTREAVEVEVLEPALRSRVDKVRIEPAPDSTPEASSIRGVARRWVVPLAPGAQGSVHHGYRISSPTAGYIPELARLGLPDSD